jgi:F-type H+-transporting ATPase subunit delta
MDLQVDVDPSLQGGIVVRVGDELVDGSVVRRLSELRRRLLR